MPELKLLGSIHIKTTSFIIQNCNCKQNVDSAGRIKAKAKLYFDDGSGSVSASEESLSDVAAKVLQVLKI